MNAHGAARYMNDDKLSRRHALNRHWHRRREACDAIINEIKLFTKGDGVKCLLYVNSIFPRPSATALSTLVAAYL